MNIFKNGVIFLLSVFLFSCVSTRLTQIFSSREINLNENLNVNIRSLRSNLSVIRVNNRLYSPTDNSNVITELRVSIINSGEKDYNHLELSALEMVFLDNFGQMNFVPYDWRNSIILGEQKPFTRNSRVNESIYFVNAKGSVPVAITTNRINHILLIDDTNSNYNEVMAFINLHLNIQNMLTMAQFISFEVINNYRKENNIDINASNIKGINLLLAGIMSKNDSVVTGAIRNGCDIHKKITHLLYGEIEPIHLAFLFNYRYAINALVNAGVNLNQLSTENNSPAIVAVRSNNVEALKLLSEYGVDLKTLMIPMSMSRPISAISYARGRNMTEIVQYLESL
jgi:hypothetical protein